MAKTKLRQLLEYIENSPGGTSLHGIARDLEISVSQAESMLDYWVRKGRLQIIGPSSACGSCSSSGSCTLLTDSLRIYQVAEVEKPNYPVVQIPCQ